MADERSAEKARLEQEVKAAELARQEDMKRKKKEELGSDANESEEEVNETKEVDASAVKDEEKPDGEEGAAVEGDGDAAPTENSKAAYERQLAQMALDEADSDDEFEPLALKIKINEFFTKNAGKKKIPSDMMSEAFRWRLSQNDCQNRGYILDGYPISYKTSLEVFFITPVRPPPKAKQVDDEGNEIEEANEEEVDAEELEKRYAPKFQSQIYPDSVILLRGENEFLRSRAKTLKAEDNKKWDPENLERRLVDYCDANDVTLFAKANNDPMLGHPKCPKHNYPLVRFFQENKTEVFEIECDGITFEMFESMRVYIERDGRSYNYLPSVGVLNVKREEELVKEEQNFKSEKANAND